MTCHAAIVSRELGIPCVVGTGEATRKLRDGEIVTVDATRGVVLEGAAHRDARALRARASAGRGRRRGGHRHRTRRLRPRRSPRTQILVNLSEPSQVERVKDLPVDGVGLLRAELMVLEALAGDHPRTLLEEGRGEEFVARMADGLSTFAGGLRAAAGDLPHDRLPHERVQRAARRRALRAARGQPDDRLPRRAALHARARRLRAGARRPAQGVGRAACATCT